MRLVGGREDVDLLGPRHVVHLPGGERVQPGSAKPAVTSLGGNVLTEADCGQGEVPACQRHHIHDYVLSANILINEDIA